MSERSTNRVLHVTEASNAGVGGHVLDLLEGLPRHGWDVHFAFSPRRMDDYFAERLARQDSSLLTRISMRRGPHWSDWAAVNELWSCIQRHGPFDIIHAHSTKAGGLCRIGKIRQAGKVVYTPNGIYSMNPTANPITRRCVQLAERKLAARTDLIIAVSPEEEQHMVEIGIRPESIRMVPNGLRQINWETRDRTRRELGLPESALILGFLGRLASQKNPLMLLRAFAKIRDIHPQLRLAIAGEGPLEADGKQEAARLGLEQQVDWLGFKTAEQVIPAVDVFVMPSRYEGMPYVMMEAIDFGLPIVATRVGGTSLGIDDGVNGWIVECDDVDQLATALQKLVDPELRSRMSAAAKIKSAEFDLELMVRRTNNVYLEALGAVGGGQSRTRSELQEMVT